MYASRLCVISHSLRNDCLESLKFSIVILVSTIPNKYTCFSFMICFSSVDLDAVAMDALRFGNLCTNLAWSFWSYTIIEWPSTESSGSCGDPWAWFSNGVLKMTFSSVPFKFREGWLLSVVFFAHYQSFALHLSYILCLQLRVTSIMRRQHAWVIGKLDFDIGCFLWLNLTKHVLYHLSICTDHASHFSMFCVVISTLFWIIPPKQKCLGPINDLAWAQKCSFQGWE